MLNISKENRTFGAIYFIQNFINCLFFSFIVLYLKQAGYSESKIGLLMSVTIIITIISQPVIGYISDHYISIKKILMFFLGTMLVCAGVIPFLKQYYIVLFILFIFISLTGRSIGVVLDGYASKVASKRSGLNFGFVRGAGSLGFGIIAIAAGYLADYFGLDILFVLHTVFAILTMIALSKGEDVEVAKPEAEGEKPSFLAAMKELVKNKPLITVVAACGILWTGIGASGTYMSVILLELGGTSGDYGTAISLAAFSEVPIMWNFYKLLRYTTVSKLLMISFFVYIFRMIIMLAIPNVQVVVFLHLLQSVSFGIFAPAILRKILELVPNRLSSSAIMLATSLYSGIGGALATLLGGIVLETAGFYGFYTFCLVFTVIGTCVLLFSLIKYKKPKEE